MATEHDSTTIPTKGKYIGPRDPVTRDYPMYFDGQPVGQDRTSAPPLAEGMVAL